MGARVGRIKARDDRDRGAEKGRDRVRDRVEELISGGLSTMLTYDTEGRSQSCLGPFNNLRLYANSLHR